MITFKFGLESRIRVFRSQFWTGFFSFNRSLRSELPKFISEQKNSKFRFRGTKKPSAKMKFSQKWKDRVFWDVFQSCHTQTHWLLGGFFGLNCWGRKHHLHTQTDTHTNMSTHSHSQSLSFTHTRTNSDRFELSWKHTHIHTHAHSKHIWASAHPH